MAITNEGDSQSYAYTGGMQSFTAPQKGIYKLEVYGAQGGGGSGGLGGYSYGHVLLEKGAVLYICCGQEGVEASTATTYNGGGGGKSQYFDLTPNYKPTRTGSSGGGATHIATRSGTLAALGSTSGLLIAAGGGGGAAAGDGLTSGGFGSGGTGGGTSGGSGIGSSGWTTAGGTQTSGYAFGQGATGINAWADYDGNANYACNAAGGGGGGLYGGTVSPSVNNHEPSSKSGGGGGSGYIGGVPSLTYFGTTYGSGTSNGKRSGGGYAVITFVKKGELPVTFNGTTLQRIIFNGVEVGSLIYNGTKLFMERMKRRVCGWLSDLKGQESSGRAGTAAA